MLGSFKFGCSATLFINLILFLCYIGDGFGGDGGDGGGFGGDGGGK